MGLIPHHDDFNFFNQDVTIEFWWKRVADGDPTSDYNPYLGHASNDPIHSIEQDAILTKGRFNNNVYDGWGFSYLNDGTGQYGSPYEGGTVQFMLCAGGGVETAGCGWNGPCKSSYGWCKKSS